MWKVQEIQPGVAEIRMQYRAGWEQYLLLMSDLHWDNPKSRRDLICQHLDKAKERNAPVFMNGDVFCAMQGWGDPRSRKGDLLAIHDGREYLNRLAETAVWFFEPYAQVIARVGMGNHESAVLKRREFDLIRSLTVGLRNAGSTVVRGGYKHWTMIRLEHEGGGRRITYPIYSFHGSGGGGRQTKGINKSAQRAQFLPDAKIVHTGHSHFCYADPIERHRITQLGREHIDYQYAIQTPGYKEEWLSDDGFATEGEHGPKAIGCVWVKLHSPDGSNVKISVETDLEPVRKDDKWKDPADNLEERLRNYLTS
jgi:hypothetical protein